MQRIALFLFLLALPAMATNEKLKTYIGKVEGKITVLANGEVASVELKNIKDDALNAFLTGAVKKWQFDPMRINGQPVDVTTSFRFSVITTYDSKLVIKSMKYAHIVFEKTELEKQKYAELKDVQKRKEIVYPREALRFGLEGLLTAVVKISAEGTVADAAVINMALLGVEDNGGTKIKAFAEKTFARNALHAVRQWSWSKDELQYNQCQNGCIRSIQIDYSLHGAPGWQPYSSIKMQTPVWVSVANEANEIFDTNSQLVRLKRIASNPSNGIDG